MLANKMQLNNTKFKDVLSECLFRS